MNLLPVDNDLNILSNLFEQLASIDEEMNSTQKANILSQINNVILDINEITTINVSTIKEELTELAASIDMWSSQHPADILLRDVLSIYFNNYGISFSNYSEEEKATIEIYSNLCLEEFGKGVYFANVIAGTLFEKDYIESCTPIQGLNKKTKNQALQNEKISVYPSLTNGIIFIDTSERDVECIRIYDIFGRIIQHYQKPVGYLEVDIKKETPGIYFVEITFPNNTHYVEKVVLK